MSIVSTVGIDLAKNVFSVHGVDARGTVVVRRAVSRAKLTELVAQLPPCLIGMEACSGAHEWARRFSAFGGFNRSSQRSIVEQNLGIRLEPQRVFSSQAFFGVSY